MGLFGGKKSKHGGGSSSEKFRPSNVGAREFYANESCHNHANDNIVVDSSQRPDVLTNIFVWLFLHHCFASCHIML